MASGDRYFTVLATIAVTVAVGAVVWRVVETVSPPVLPPQAPGREPTPVDDWEQYLAVGHRLGPPDARVVVLEFADFECPACRTFTLQGMAPLLAKYPDDLAVVFRHWPLPSHKFSYQSARVAECAAEQGRFEPMHNLLYQKQDSLGLKSWRGFAEESGVPDLARFEACASRTGPVPAIDADSAVAIALGGTGTPVVIIEGIRYPGAPVPAKLEQLIDSAMTRVRP